VDASADDTSCSWFTSCPHTAVLLSGEATIALQTKPSASCSNYLAEGPLCGCAAADRSESLELIGVGFDEACGLAAGVCTGEVELSFGTEISCAESGRYYQSDGCNFNAVCGPVAALGDDKVARKVSDYSIGCGVSSDEFWHCSCLGRPEATIGFTLTNTVADPCTELVDLCYPASKSIERIDAWRCDPGAPQLDSDDCVATLPCDGHATIDDTEVDLRVAVDMRCTPGIDSWACECGGDGTAGATPFAVPLETDASATCHAALAQCQYLAETDEITVRAL
jgi:hypothetical protein